MKTIAFDTETHLIKPGQPCPKLVCVSVADEGGLGERGTGYVLDRVEGTRWLKEKFCDTDVRLVGHHTPYDLGIACAEDRDMIEMVYDAIDREAITDTLLRQKIIDNALGELKFSWDDELEEYRKQRYGLDYVAWRLLGRQRDKGEDTWRMRYRELDGVPIPEWPEAARLYAEYDAEDTMAMYLWQHNLEPSITGENWQMEAAWALHLASVWGMRTDPERVARIREQFTREWEIHLALAQEWGFVRTDKKRSKDTKAISAAVLEWFDANDAGPAPETPTGKVSLKREVLVGTDHPGLLAVAEMGKWRKRLTTYVPVLERGTLTPINCNYNAILETFRTSCSKPNMQNLPQKGGIRECFIPRDGWLYLFVDYSTLEMRSLAQVCLWLFGHSALAEALREGRDLHLDMAAQMMGITYQEAQERMKAGDPEVKFFRKQAKPINFGVPGGMGAKKLIEYAKGYGVELSLDQSKLLKDTFLQRWPEMVQYFEHCSGLCGGDKAPVIEFPGSGMLRGDVMYTAVCNGFFQHLAACGAKQAMYEVSKACYTKRDSPLYGSRPIAFIHDEIGLEIPDDGRLDGASKEVQRIMDETMTKWIPDVPGGTEATAMRRWFKGAEPVLHNGLLVPGKPVKKEERTLWVPDLIAV